MKVRAGQDLDSAVSVRVAVSKVSFCGQGKKTGQQRDKETEKHSLLFKDP